MRYVGFVPVRGGSKSVPRKNVLPIAGKPLCLWVIGEAALSQRLDHVYVSTDDDEIRAVVESARIAGVTVVDRSPETASDSASTESAMIEFARSRDFEAIVLMQATSPLLRAVDIDLAITRFESCRADSLVSVVPQKRFIWSVDDDGNAIPQNYDPCNRPRRQNFKGYHVENGAFYISKREGLLETGSRLFGRIAAHPMGEETYCELDEPVDWRIIEAFLLDRRC